MTRALVSLCALGLALLASGCPDERCCSIDDDCASGAACFEGMCAQRCTVDAQCREGQTCTGVVCVDPLRDESACDFVDADSPWTFVTDDPVTNDGGEPPDVPSCTDALEPNDGVDDAFRLFTPNDFPVEGAELCAGDEDWFAVNVNGGELFSVQLLFDAEEADLDLEILHRTELARLDVYAASRGVTGVEEASLRPDAAGVYYIRIYAFDDASARYDLSISLFYDGPICVDDGFEENDGRAFASSLPEGSTAAEICMFDVDVFRFEVAPGESVFVSMTEPSPQLAPQMWGFSPEWGAVWSGLSYATALPGEHFVVVEPIQGVASADGWPYMLSRVDAPAEPCPAGFDDGNEPNDDFGSATDLGQTPTEVFGVACPSSPDFYRVQWAPGGPPRWPEPGGPDIRVDSPDLQVALFQGDRLLWANGRGMDWLAFERPSEDADEFYVVVTAPPGWGGPYLLEVD